MVYSDAYAAGYRMDDSMSGYPLWVADYGADEPDVSANWTAWTGWQYTDEGRVSGVSGRVDLDRFTDGVLLREEERPVPEEVWRYQVRPGDTLWALARRYGTTVGAIARLNALADPNLIYVGGGAEAPRGGPGEDLYRARRRYLVGHLPAVWDHRGRAGGAQWDPEPGSHLSRPGPAAARMKSEGRAPEEGPALRGYSAAGCSSG